MSREQLHLEQAPRIVHLPVEVAQPIDELRGVRELTVIGTQIREQEKNAA